LLRVLIAEPDAALRAELLRAVRRAGYLADEVAAAADAPARAARSAFDLALLDISNEGDLAALEALRRAQPRLAVVATAARPSLESAIAAMKQGACDVLRKPFALAALERALAAALCSAQPPAAAPAWPATQDPVMERCLQLLRAAAASDATALLRGESGCGKELLARELHRHSARCSGPFIAVSCAALPAALAESELFGHERGAFTGAEEARAGQIAAAHGGTLLLDEVGDLAPELQPKLLRVLQEREVQPVGALSARAVDVRIVATTQHCLETEVAAGRFRADLYYRLDVIVIEVPPLRARPADLEPLARGFLDRFARGAGCEPPQLTPASLARLRAHPFRGNVRELENLMRRAVVLYPGREIDAERLLGALPAHASAASRPAAAQLNLRELERRTIELSLAETRGNRTHAAQRLGISVRTLRNKIRCYGLA
jgi:DNA-binding NtrC family response regulator